MSGVRLHHPSKRDCTIEIPHPGRPTPHGPKLYRLTFDSDGDTIVSTTVLARVLEAFACLQLAPTFLVCNEVKDPPPLVIGGPPPPRPRPTYREAP